MSSRQIDSADDFAEDQFDDGDHRIQPLTDSYLGKPKFTRNYNRNGNIDNVGNDSHKPGNDGGTDHENSSNQDDVNNSQDMGSHSLGASNHTDNVVPDSDEGSESTLAEKDNGGVVIQEWVQASVIPVGERRGLLSRFTLVPELDNALGYSNGVKAFIVLVVSMAAIIAPMGASILLPALNDVSTEFHVSTTVVNVSFGLYVLSLGIFPLWWSGFSELNGRRNVYVVSFVLYTAFSIGCALAPNIAGLMILRVLAGGAAASVQAVGAGTISDIYATTQRGRAMGYFYLGPLCGPLLAPIIGGAIATKWGWRGTQWFCVILGGVMTIFIIFGLPETLKRVHHLDANGSRSSRGADTSHDEPLDENGELDIDNVEVVDMLVPIPSTISHREAQKSAFYTVQKRLKKAFHHSHKHANNTEPKSSPSSSPEEPATKKQHSLLYEAVVRPLRSFRFLRFPPVPLSMVYASYCFCALYFLNIGIVSLYSDSPYNFSVIILGLLYIPNSVGYIFSSIGNGYWSDRIIARSIKKHGKVVAEDRLSENVFIAAAIFPVALLIFGWAGDQHTFWLVPLVGTFLFGVSSMLIFGNVTTYLIDALPGRGSSGVALNNFFRMILAAIATFVAEPLQNAMGFGWLYTMLAIGSVLAFSSILAIKKWGSQWRETYDVTKFY